jgi:two-component system response regulator TctD
MSPADAATPVLSIAYQPGGTRAGRRCRGARADNAAMRILLAEDEHALGEWLAKALEQAGFQVQWLDDGRLVERALAEHDFDALVLDLGLPGRSGHEVLRRLRAQDRRLPVLILTARDSLSERVGTLNEGADDFLAKPFALAELEARLLALIRRARGSEHPRLSCGPLQFEAATRRFTLGDEALALSPREQALLRALILKAGEPVARQALIDRVFGDDDDVQPSAIDVLLHRLRKRLEGRGVRIHTYRGLGYVLEPDRHSDLQPQERPGGSPAEALDERPGERPDGQPAEGQDAAPPAA